MNQKQKLAAYRRAQTIWGHIQRQFKISMEERFRQESTLHRSTEEE